MLCVEDFITPRIVAVTNFSEQKNITPRFEFGFGLSYTTFKYSNLRIEKLSYSETFPEEAIWESGKTPSTNATGASRAIWLHRPAYCITFDVQNDGEIAGTEVGQERFISDDSPNKSSDLLIPDAAVILGIPNLLWRAPTNTQRIRQRSTETWGDATSRDHHLQVRPFLLGRRWSGLEETGWQHRCPYIAEQ
jgi:hypothetical protein